MNQGFTLSTIRCIVINDIINGENLVDLFKQADDDDSEDEELSECDTVGTIHENEQSTPEASDLNLFKAQ